MHVGRLLKSQTEKLSFSADNTTAQQRSCENVPASFMPIILFCVAVSSQSLLLIDAPCSQKKSALVNHRRAPWLLNIALLMKVTRCFSDSLAHPFSDLSTGPLRLLCICFPDQPGKNGNTRWDLGWNACMLSNVWQMTREISLQVKFRNFVFGIGRFRRVLALS